MRQLSLSVSSLLLLFATNTWSQTWEPVTGANELSALFSDTVMTATLKDNVTAIATYNSDGSGELKAWGDTFPRAWQVKGDDRVCIDIDKQTRCFSIEKDSSGTNQYRAQDVDSGEFVVFIVKQSEITVSPNLDSDAGGASQPSAEEIAQ